MTRYTARIVLEGHDALMYAAISFPANDVPETELNELAELIAPDWDSAGFVPDETESLSVKYDGIHIRFIRVEKVKRCLFSIQPC